MPQPTLSEDLLALGHLKQMKSDAERIAKNLDAEFKRHQRDCMERMDAEGAEGHKADGTTYSPVTKEYATVQDRQAFVSWALDNDSELVEYKERGEQLNALVRAKLDDGEELPPGIGFYLREYISMRSA
jgi:hypothetical protein